MSHIEFGAEIYVHTNCTLLRSISLVAAVVVVVDAS